MKRFFTASFWTFYRAIAILPPILVLALAGSVLHRELLANHEAIAQFVLATISESLEFDVTADRVDAITPGNLTIKGLQISTPAYGTLLTARDVRIRYSLRKLLGNLDSPAHITSRIDLEGVEVYLERDREGKINYAEAFADDEPTEKPFLGRLFLKDAYVRYIDYLPPSGTDSPMIIEVFRAKGDLDLRSGKGGYFNLEAPRTSLSQRVRIRGAYDDQGSLMVNNWLTGAQLAFIGEYLVPEMPVTLTGGTADGTVILALDEAEGNEFRLSVEALVAGGSFTSTHLPRTSMVDGALKVSTDGLVSFDGWATTLGSRVRLKASLAGFESPAVSLDAYTTSVKYPLLLTEFQRYAEIPADISVRGSGPVNIRVGGTLAKPEVRGKAVIPSLAYKNYRIRDVRSEFSFLEGEFRADASAAGMGGRLYARMNARPGDQPIVTVDSRFNNLDLALVSPELRGRASGNATARYASGAWTGRGNLTTDQPSIRGVQFGSIRASAGIGQNQITLNSLLATTRTGFVSASGTASLNGPLDIQVAAVGIDLADLKTVTPEPLQGLVDVKGTVTGTVQKPLVAAQAQGYNLAFHGESVDSMQGAFTATLDAITLDEVLIARGPSEAVVSGSITNLQDASLLFDLSSDIRSLDLALLAEYVPALEGLEGRAFGRIERLQGNLKDFSARLEMELEAIDFRDFEIPAASVVMEYDRGAILIEDLTAKRGETALKLTGSISRNREINGNFTLSDFPALELFNMAAGKPGPVDGLLDLAGTAIGTLDDPVVTARLLTQDLKIADEPVVVSWLDLAWQDGVAEISGSQIELAGGIAFIESARFLTDDSVAGDFEASLRLGVSRAFNGEEPAPILVNRLLAMARSLGLFSEIESEGLRQTAFSAPEQVSGQLQGLAKVERENGVLRASLDLEATNFGWGAESVSTVQLKGSRTAMGYEVESLVVEDGPMLVIGKGRFTAAGVITADVDGFNVPLNKIPATRYVSEKPGLADFSFEASGNVADPRVEGSVLVRDIQLGGVDIEQIDTGRIVLNAEGARIEQGSLTSGSYQVRFSGVAPFSLTRMAFVEGGETAFVAELPGQQMDILSLLTDRVDESRTQGEVVALLEASGAWPVVELNGYFRIADGTVAIKGMSTLLEKIDIDVNLKGDTISVDRFQVNSSDGGRLVVAGGAAVSDGTWILNTTAKTRDFTLRFANITGKYDERFNGKLDLALQALGPVGAPQISGRLTVHDASIGTTTLPEEETEERIFAFNPTFDLIFEAGRKTRVRNPRMNIGVSGQVALTQDLNNPALRGRLDVLEGNLLVPGNRFRIIPVGVISFAHDSQEGARVTLNLEAETNIASQLTPAGFSGLGYQVIMRVTGSLTSPEVSFRSNPPGLTDSNILALMGQKAGIGPEGFGSSGSFERELAGVFAAGLAPGILMPIETALADAFGFQEVTFGFGGQYVPLNVQVSRRLFDGFFLTYSWSLENEYPDSWKLSYMFAPRFRLSYGESQFRSKYLAVEGSLSF